MSVDKRSVATDALETLGRCPIPDDSGRDAIHLAVEPAVAAEKLFPGQDIGFVDGKASAKAEIKLGIVDPFIEGQVLPGQLFWLVVYPRKITSLRHVWTHPGFEEAPEAPLLSREASEAWLREFIRGADCPDYDTVIAAAVGDPVEIVDPVYGDEAYRIDNYGDGEIYLFFSGRDAHSAIPPEFWDHVEVVTGRKVLPGHRATHFTCSC